MPYEIKNFLQPTVLRWKLHVNYEVKANQGKVCNGLKFFWSSSKCMGVLVNLFFFFYITKTVSIEEKEKKQQYWYKNRQILKEFQVINSQSI